MRIPNRRELEAKLGGRIERLSKRHRRELREALGNPPKASNVPAAFWARLRREMEDETAAILLLLFGVSAQLHIGSVGADFAGVKEAMLSDAKTHGRKGSRKLGKTYAKGARIIFDRQAAKWEPDTKPSQEAVDEAVEKALGKKRADRLSVDATTESLSRGGEAGVGATVGLSPDDLWINRPGKSRTGPCRICKPLHRKPRSFWGLKYVDGPGEDVHPGCVCEIEYVAELEKGTK